MFSKFLLAKFTWPTHQDIFGSSFFLETTLWSESLKRLIGFLAYLKPKLWLKNPIFENKSFTKGIICPLKVILFSHSLATDWARELLKPSKTAVLNSFRSPHPGRKEKLFLHPLHHLLYCFLHDHRCPSIVAKVPKTRNWVGNINLATVWQRSSHPKKSLLTTLGVWAPPIENHCSKAAMSNPRPSLGFDCSKTILHADNLSLFW